MRIFCSLREFRGSGSGRKTYAVTIGVFDGVHLGHRQIVKTLLKKAKRKKVSSLLITFDPHPARVICPSKKVPLLISLNHRLGLLSEMGIDCALVLRFDSKFAGMGAGDFLRDVIGKMQVSDIVVGENFFFGRDKKGSLRDLRRFSGCYGYRVNVVPAVRSGAAVISSTRIRNLIVRGGLEDAAKLLARPVAVLGTVIKGHRRGRIIGYPTANINPHHEAIPPSGVYAVKVKYGNKVLNGVLNIGVRPTFERGGPAEREPTIEVHMFDFKKTIYGEDLEIAFVEKIREEKKFPDPAALREQIKKDEIYCKKRCLQNRSSMIL